jgi:hypothetical protein
MPKTTAPRVMISSTFIDLKEHREAAINALLAAGLFPVVMEHNIGSPDDHVISSSLAMVDSAAAYMCLIGDRYGQTPTSAKHNPTGLSVTELEFQRAQNKPLPTRLLVMGDRHPIPRELIERDPDKQRKLAAFRASAKKLEVTGDLHRIYQTFDSLEEFKLAIANAAHSLRDHFAHPSRQPAVPPNPTPSSLATQPVLTIPAPRHTLGRLAALVALALLVLSALGIIDQALAQRLGVDLTFTPQLRIPTLFVLPALVLLAQAILEFHTRRTVARQRLLAFAPAAVPAGYFRIGPYRDTPTDRAAFTRADNAHLHIREWLERAAGAPLYLTGQSGCGKSSLIDASVIPALRDAGFATGQARAWQNPLAALAHAVASLPGTPRPRRTAPPPADLRTAIEAAARRARAGLLLVIDQFEEFAILAKPDAQAEFTAFLADLAARPIPGLRLLLAFRSDCMKAVMELGLPPLLQDSNWREIGAFSPLHAEDFLVRSGLALAPAAVDSLLATAARLDDLPGLIRPVTLNIIGHVLTQGPAHAPSLDANRLTSDYIARTLDSPELRDHARAVIEHLITAQGTKQPRPEAELSRLTGLVVGQVRAILNGLARAGLARPLDAAAATWELSHDFVARVLARHLGQTRRQFLRRAARHTAPALVVISITAGTGAIAWEQAADSRARSRLAELGFAASPTKDNPNLLHIQVTSAFNPYQIDDLVPALRRLAPRIASLNGGRVLNTLTPLAILPALQTLDLSYTDITDFHPLSSLTTLRFLDLKGTNIKNIAPLSSLRALQSLNLGRTQVSSLNDRDNPASGMRLGLADIDLRKRSPLSFEVSGPISLIQTLQTLDLSDTQVSDLRPLSFLHGIQTINIARTRVTDLTPLAALPKLKHLNRTGLPEGIEAVLPRRAEIEITRRP